jgi:hypothetical protein
MPVTRPTRLSRSISAPVVPLNDNYLGFVQLDRITSDRIDCVVVDEADHNPLDHLEEEDESSSTEVPEQVPPGTEKEPRHGNLQSGLRGGLAVRRSATRRRTPGEKYIDPAIRDWKDDIVSGFTTSDALSTSGALPSC